MAEERVAIEIHFGVQGHDLAFASDDQGVDFRKRSVALFEGAIESLHHAGHFAGQLRRHSQRERQAPALIRRQADDRIDGLL